MLAILVVLSLVAGGASIRPAWRPALEGAGIRFVSARDVHAMLERRDRVVVIDARDEVHYHRGHLPGAISVPAEDRPLRFVDIRRPKRLFHPDRLPADRETPVVFYCGGPN